MSVLRDRAVVHAVCVALWSPRESRLSLPAPPGADLVLAERAAQRIVLAVNSHRMAALLQQAAFAPGGGCPREAVPPGIELSAASAHCSTAGCTESSERALLPTE